MLLLPTRASQAPGDRVRPRLMLTAISFRRADSVGGLPPYRKACSGEYAGDLGYHLARNLIASTAAVDRLSVNSHRLNNCILMCSSTVSAFLSA